MKLNKLPVTQPARWLRHLTNTLKSRPSHPISRTYLTARMVWRVLRRRRIRMERLLCGGEQGLTGQQFARHTGDVTRTSKPVSQSPHSQLLELYQQIGDRVFEPEVLQQTCYYLNAATCIRSFGIYFGAVEANQIVYLAKNLVNKYNGDPLETGTLVSSASYSRSDLPVSVAPIEYSNCFQVLDGNHRLAVACARGAKNFPVHIVRRPQLTCLQQLLLDVSWNANRREIYQPIDSPELGDRWRLVRSCDDRMDLMLDFLKARDLLPPRSQTYIDIACNYGWFVRSMQDKGFCANGLELDWAAREIGINFYDLGRDQFIAEEVVRFLRGKPPQYDIVSCFSLVHHFVMGRGAVSAEKLIGWLDALTARVLFFEMGDEHEAWFRKSLSGWNPASIEEWLYRHTSFQEIIPLGTDNDRVPPYEENYGRTLFACVR